MNDYRKGIPAKSSRTSLGYFSEEETERRLKELADRGSTVGSTDPVPVPDAPRTDQQRPLERSAAKERRLTPWISGLGARATAKHRERKAELRRKRRRRPVAKRGRRATGSGVRARPNTCIEPGCDGKVLARGWCQAHYHAWRNQLGGRVRPADNAHSGAAS
jgi:hypothetical protein